MCRLEKPRSSESYGGAVSAYHDEYVKIDSTTKVVDACMSCHPSIHKHVGYDYGVGVGGSLGIGLVGASGAATWGKGGKLVASTSVTLFGATGAISTSYNLDPGPHASLGPGHGLPTGSGTGTYSAEPDNTRVGG